jgi:hypothetical protein
MKFKFSLIFLLCATIHLDCIAQNLSSSVQNIGGQSRNATIECALVYSIGEMASIQNFIGTNNYHLSTGFLQSFTPIVTGVNELISIPNASLSIAPNPTSQFIQIQTQFSQLGILQFQLMDMRSKIRYQLPPISINGNFQKRVDLNEYPSGVYFIKVQFQPSRGPAQQSVYKIIKL